MDEEKSSKRNSFFTVISDSYFKNNFEISFSSNKNINTNSERGPFSFKEYLLKDSNKNQFINDNSESITKSKNNLLGIFYLFISVFLLSLSHLISKFLIIHFPKVENLANNFIRGIFLVIISQKILHKNKISLFNQLNKNKHKTILLLIRCFFGAICNITLFESFKYMRISSAFTIFCTYPIFVSIFSILILKSNFLLFDILSYLFCIFSVILISKPAFIFNNNTNNEPGSDTPYGVFLSILSSLINAIGVYINKSIAYDFDNLISTYFFGVWFIISTSILLPFSEYGLKTLDFQSFLLICLSSLIFFFGVILFVEALNIGEPIKILPVFYFGIVFSLIYNCFIFGKETDFFDVLGSVIIIVFNVMGTLIVRSSSK